MIRVLARTVLGLWFSTSALASPQVTLVEAGVEPRVVLRLAPEVGATQRVKHTLHTDASVDMGLGMAMPIHVPGMWTARDIEVLDVSATGDITYRTTVADAGVVQSPTALPSVTDMAQAAMKELLGAGGTTLVSQRGEVKAVNATLAAGTGDDLRIRIESELTPLGPMLPVEAVGAGGRWTVTEDVNQEGIAVSQVTTYTVRSMDKGVVMLGVGVQQSARDSSVSVPGLPKGTKATLTSLESSGSGSVRFEAGRVVQLSDLRMDLATSVSMETGGEAMDIKSTVQARRRVE